MNLTSLRAKGVEPSASRRAVLRGWRIAFDVHHWFRHEGGVGNIHPSKRPRDEVHGIVHTCVDEDLRKLDIMESRGVGYEREWVEVESERKLIRAVAYVGLPTYLDAECLPTQRYLNILVRGAQRAGLAASYVDMLRHQPVFRPKAYPPFVHPPGEFPSFNRETLATHPSYTALAGAVFDMSTCRPKLECVIPLFGGKDMTLFHLKRLDTSDGSETWDDVAKGRISDAGRDYLNAYLHEYDAEFRYVGPYRYDT